MSEETMKHIADLYVEITNLKETFEYENARNYNLYLENEQLKERIDKAIEYIENNCLIIMNKGYIPDGVINCKDIKLVEILKGDNNE